MPTGPTTDLRMSLGSHLDELRRRIILSLAGVAVAGVIALYFGKDILRFICLPLVAALQSTGFDAQIHYFGPAEGFAVYLKVSLIVGLIASSPWVLYQAWQFIAVGMYEQERRAVVMLVPFSATMVALGMLFLYYAMLPICLAFLVQFSAGFGPVDGVDSWMVDLFKPDEPIVEPAGKPDANEPSRLAVLDDDPSSPRDGDVWLKMPEAEIRLQAEGRRYVLRPTTGPKSMMSPTIGVGQYISFVTLLAIGITVAFQLPVVMLIVGWTRLVPPRLLARYRPHCVLGCFVLAMILTPADPFSMVLLALPMWGLFELGMLLMRAVYKEGTGSGERGARS